MHSLPRRFGHAATDRQLAYLSADEIAEAERADPLLGACAAAVAAGFVAAPGALARFDHLRAATERAFDAAAAERKAADPAAWPGGVAEVRAALRRRTSAPLPAPAAAAAVAPAPPRGAWSCAST